MDYLSNIELRSFAERERFFHFSQFLSFIKNCKRSKLKSREVYQIVFPVIDFLRFIGRDEKSHYQRTKMLKVIRSFQTLDPILEKLSNNCFRSSVLFPTLQIEKKDKRKTWVVTLDIVKSIYCYNYPFVLILLLTGKKPTIDINLHLILGLLDPHRRLLRKPSICLFINFLNSQISLDLYKIEFVDEGTLLPHNDNK